MHHHGGGRVESLVKNDNGHGGGFAVRQVVTDVPHCGRRILSSALAKPTGERIQDVAVASANPQEREDEAQPKRLAKLCRNKSSKNATNDENLSVPPNAIMEDWK